MKAPLRVAVTGAAGNIGYSLLFRLASGEALGKDQPIILQLLEITDAMKALEGVAIELSDCAFPLLHDMVLTDDDGFLVVWDSWASPGDDDSEDSIQGRFFSAEGVGVGPQFQLNSHTPGKQRIPSVSRDETGNFVVSWWSESSTGDDASGHPVVPAQLLGGLGEQGRPYRHQGDGADAGGVAPQLALEADEGAEDSGEGQAAYHS